MVILHTVWSVELANSEFPSWKNSSPAHFIHDHTRSLWLAYCVALIHSTCTCNKSYPVNFFSVQSCGSQKMSSVFVGIFESWFTHVYKQHTDCFISPRDMSRCFDLKPSQCIFYQMASLIHTPSRVCINESRACPVRCESVMLFCRTRVWRAEQPSGVNLKKNLKKKDLIRFSFRWRLKLALPLRN